MEKEESRGSTINNTNTLLMESFSRDAKRAATLIDELSSKEGWQENEDDVRKFTIAVHGIKSPLKNVGELQLFESARTLEQACRDNRIDYVTSSTPSFLDGLRALITRIESEQSRNTASDDSAEDGPDIVEKLLAIGEQCADYNRRGVINLIAEIDICSAETRAVLNKVKELAMQSDFEDAESAVAEYISKLKSQ